jgi:diguanylate cyclase (GGDEF)-like protein
MLDHEVARGAREGRTLTVVMIDVDHFKAVNDRYGHRTGDRVLQTLATLLQTRTRAEDVVCRYGGEEFVVVLVGSAPVEASQRTEQWRREFADLRHLHDGGDLSTTLSAGIAAYPSDGATGDEVLHAADRALYAAKRGGRNRVVAQNREPDVAA